MIKRYQLKQDAVNHYGRRFKKDSIIHKPAIHPQLGVDFYVTEQCNYAFPAYYVEKDPDGVFMEVQEVAVVPEAQTFVDLINDDEQDARNDFFAYANAMGLSGSDTQVLYWNAARAMQNNAINKLAEIANGKGKYWRLLVLKKLLVEQFQEISSEIRNKKHGWATNEMRQEAINTILKMFGLKELELTKHRDVCNS